MYEEWEEVSVKFASSCRFLGQASSTCVAYHLLGVDKDIS